MTLVVSDPAAARLNADLYADNCWTVTSKLEDIQKLLTVDLPQPQARAFFAAIKPDDLAELDRDLHDNTCYRGFSSERREEFYRALAVVVGGEEMARFAKHSLQGSSQIGHAMGAGDVPEVEQRAFARDASAWASFEISEDEGAPHYTLIERVPGAVAAMVSTLDRPDGKLDRVLAEIPRPHLPKIIAGSSQLAFFVEEGGCGGKTLHVQMDLKSSDRFVDAVMHQGSPTSKCRVIEAGKTAAAVMKGGANGPSGPFLLEASEHLAHSMDRLRQSLPPGQGCPP